MSQKSDTDTKLHTVRHLFVCLFVLHILVLLDLEVANSVKNFCDCINEATGLPFSCGVLVHFGIPGRVS